MDRPPDEPIRVALIGYGPAGRGFHASLVAAGGGMRLVAFVTGNRERQEQARKDRPGVRIMAELDELWDTAADHDLVVVAAPNRAHAPLGLTALEAGLAVVIDKPIATTAAAGRELVARAQQRGLLLTVFHNRRWDGDMLTLRRLLDDDALGRVLRFESRYERWRPTRRAGTWRESAAEE